MTICTVTEQQGMTLLSIEGRIDSMTSPDIQRRIDELILSGRRLLVVDIEQTSFVSSAGLRVFLSVHKQLKNVGGEIILYKIAQPVLPVFVTGGFDKIFKIIATEQELATAVLSDTNPSDTVTVTEDGTTFRLRESPAEQGALCLIGSPDKLAAAAYTEQDVVTVGQDRLRFGTGLATVGEQYAEYRQLFGEALCMNHHVFFYPAVKQPAADFMLYGGTGTGAACRFLHGFAFDGGFRYRIAFETAATGITLERLVDRALSLPRATPVAGIVLLAESRGILGMNLRQVPFQENRPPDGGSIFDAGHFAAWINFPVEPGYGNHIVAAAGIACRDKNASTPEVRKLFSEDTCAHVHAGIFEKGPIAKKLDDFEKELDRVLTRLSLDKVQHLLGRSRFGSGMLGIIELQG